MVSENGRKISNSSQKKQLCLYESQKFAEKYYQLFELKIKLKLKENVQQQQLMHDYQNIQQDTTFDKVRRSLYLVVTVSLLTHTMSITYSMMSFKQQSMGFIAIIVSSLTCFLLSSSHLTIYGISILGILYVSMLEAYYQRSQICYIVAISGILILPFWRMVHSIGAIFHCLPGRMHASMVFGTVLIVLTKFFPLAIQNIKSFYMSSTDSPLTNPLQTLQVMFEQFNVLTLALTIGSIVIMLILKDRLSKIPFIVFLVIFGIIINWTHNFQSSKDLCADNIIIPSLIPGVQPTPLKIDCKFYILKLQNLQVPMIHEIITLIPAALVLSAVVLFQQFLYLQEFERRGKRFGGGGDLGNVKTETRVLAIANIIAGCLGGLPICINMFGTYQNFAFNQKYGFKGTKWVGLLQIPVSYCLYSFASPIYQMIPLFILFTIVATPAVYFLRNMINIHYNHIFMITFVAALNVLTHPIIALIFACFISIYDMAELLKPAPSQIIMQINNEQRKSVAKIPQKQIQVDGQPTVMSEFVNRVVQIEDDIPEELVDKEYIIYRISGSITYLNYDKHLEQLKLLTSSHFFNVGKKDIIFVISFRYAQVIDQQSIFELSKLIEKLRADRVRIIITGLHLKLMEKMEKIAYFSLMLQEDQKCMFALHVGDLNDIA